MAVEKLKAIQWEELYAVMVPYVGVALVLVAIWLAIFFAKMPTVMKEDEGSTKESLLRLLKHRHYMLGVLAQFFYVGAQIGVWSFTIRYVMQEVSLREDEAANYYLIGLALFISARFLFTYLMKFIKPSLLLMGASMGAILACLVVIYGAGKLGSAAIPAVSFFMSLMFPTIYGISNRDLGKDTKLAASGQIMAILGGAVMTAIQGQVSDRLGIHSAFYVPVACFVLVGLFGLYAYRHISHH